MTEHRVALITGSRRGIGRAIALALAADGCDIVVNDYELGQLADETAAAIQALGRRVQVVQADLGDVKSIQELLDATVAHFGRLDVLVNNAATWVWEDFIAAQESSWDRMIDVDLKGPFFCSQAAARQMTKQQSGGAIINISSVHRGRVWPQDTIYGIAKAGIARLTQSLAYELGPAGIRVNAIAPGYIDSRVPNPNEPPIGQPGYASYVVPRTPLRRVGLPEDIANAAVFLASPQASFITGQTITVDGGMLLGGTPDEGRGGD